MCDTLRKAAIFYVRHYRGYYPEDHCGSCRCGCTCDLQHPRVQVTGRGAENMSFNGQRYITRGVQSKLPFELQLFMWALIAQLPEPKDYLQVFRLFVSDNETQHIIHEQEEPPYHKEFDLVFDAPVNAKVYIIDDGDHSTILLAEEY